MTEHMDLGSTPNFVERPAARHNQTIREAATHRLLADPIEFSQNMARILTTGILDDVLIQDTPKQIDDIRSEFEYLIDQALRGPCGRPAESRPDARGLHVAQRSPAAAAEVPPGVEFGL